ncbi:GatB/YqeY domain-containing protein [Patescibacteria group bacterium]|nr:GatB/YqeY domain-containing protein [Patescibacteria group bacterium]MBU1672965.1 GatB/YqeY domain-containing protein [Patescibacteria group bacterium]MBU1963000.1 GatB/YqeY domain-containing protein [Patescibacteria group bacterium]
MPHKLAETIQKDIISAQKAGEKEKLETLRLVYSEVKNRQIDLGKDLEDQEVIDLLGKEVKKRKDSIKAFTEGGREELAKKEESEIEIISVYLPEQMGEEEVREAVKKIMAENPDMDFGPLMGKAMGQLKGKADGGLVKQIVQELQK